MDPDVSRWVLEFLLRSSVPDSLITKTLTALPLSGFDSRLKKTLLLRTLHSQLSKSSLSESSLIILETLEQIHLNQNDAVSLPESMPHAYCALAVDCTLRYLAAHPDPAASAEYFAAVKRIWRGRVAAMEAGRRSGLFSGEMARWRDDIEAAVWDPRVSERLAGLNTRREASCKVRVYLEEAWEAMGPSFLDSVAKKGLWEGLGAEPIRECDGGVEGSEKESGSESDHGDGGGACGMEDVVMNGGNDGKERLEERVEVSVDGNVQVGGCESASVQRDKATRKGNTQLRRKHTALRTCHRGVQISGVEEVDPNPEKLWSKYDDPLPSSEVKKVRESLKLSSLELRALVKDPLPDALRTSEVVRSKLATRDANHEPPIENQSEDEDVPEAVVCKSIVPYQPNDVNLGKKTSVRSSGVARPNLMEQNSTARTYEWDDSIDNMPQARQPRRRKRKWTSLEEETLRDGVKKFGEGNWATIRSFYSNIFVNRSGVDLKDKWRNMIR